MTPIRSAVSSWHLHLAKFSQLDCQLLKAIMRHEKARPSHQSQAPRGRGLNLGVLFSAKSPVRINLSAMAWPISRRLRLGMTASVLSGERNRRSASVTTMDATAFSGFARRTAEFVSDFASVIHNLAMDVRDSYRPELHYMRGPGPKWRAKHQRWPGVDPQPVTQAEQCQLLPLYMRRRDAASSSR